MNKLLKMNETIVPELWLSSGKTGSGKDEFFGRQVEDGFVRMFGKTFEQAFGRPMIENFSTGSWMRTFTNLHLKSDNPDYAKRLDVNDPDYEFQGRIHAVLTSEKGLLLNDADTLEVIKRGLEDILFKYNVPPLIITASGILRSKPQAKALQAILELLTKKLRQKSMIAKGGKLDVFKLFEIQATDEQCLERRLAKPRSSSENKAKIEDNIKAYAHEHNGQQPMNQVCTWFEALDKFVEIDNTTPLDISIENFKIKFLEMFLQRTPYWLKILSVINN